MEAEGQNRLASAAAQDGVNKPSAQCSHFILYMNIYIYVLHTYKYNNYRII